MISLRAADCRVSEFTLPDVAPLTPSAAACMRRLADRSARVGKKYLDPAIVQSRAGLWRARWNTQHGVVQSIDVYAFDCAQ
jgi:hypothetical protein